MLTLTSFFMLVLAILPHHHHADGLFHFFPDSPVKSSCELPIIPEENGHHEHSNCLIDRVYTIQTNESASRFKTIEIKIPGYLLTYTAVLGSVLKDNLPLSGLHSPDPDIHLTYQSLVYSNSYGLRAPPFHHS